MNISQADLTQEQIEALSESPFSKIDLGRMRRSPMVRTLRLTLKITQEEFSRRYSIPLGTLRDWEQNRSEPDAPARAYLKAIAGNPEAVAKALLGKSAA